MGMTGRRRYLIKTLVTMAFFLVLALINILTVFSEHLLTTQFSKAEIIARLGSRWIFWILLTPLIYGLSDAFPLERAARKRSLAVHVLASLLTSAAYTLLSASWVFRLGNSPATAISHSVFSYLQPTQIIFYWGLVGISHALRFQGLLRAHEMQALRLEKELADARLHVQRSQLHPHFLFNTMHTIANLIRDESYPAAIETISGISELLRLSLANLDTQFVPLKEEIDYLNLYLDIEKIRFKDRLSAAVEIPPDLLSCRVPFLILQPFVENALKHGLARREGAQSLRVSAARAGASLRIAIEDDGPGLPPGWSLETSSGIGLQNVSRRLAALYGDDGRLDLRNRAGAGTAAVLTIPLSLFTT